MVKIEKEQIERVTIKVKLDDAQIEKAMAYCRDHGYQVVHGNPIIRDYKLTGKYRIIAEKPIEDRENAMPD